MTSGAELMWPITHISLFFGIQVHKICEDASVAHLAPQSNAECLPQPTRFESSPRLLLFIAPQRFSVLSLSNEAEILQNDLEIYIVENYKRNE